MADAESFTHSSNVCSERSNINMGNWKHWLNDESNRLWSGVCCHANFVVSVPGGFELDAMTINSSLMRCCSCISSKPFARPRHHSSFLCQCVLCSKYKTQNAKYTLFYTKDGLSLSNAMHDPYSSVSACANQIPCICVHRFVPVYIFSRCQSRFMLKYILMSDMSFLLVFGWSCVVLGLWLICCWSAICCGSSCFKTGLVSRSAPICFCMIITGCFFGSCGRGADFMFPIFFFFLFPKCNVWNNIF